MQMMARGWLVLRLSNDSPFALSLVMIAFALPMTCMSLIGGALADRWPRKHILMTVQTGNTLMTLLLATLDLTGLVRFWHLITIGFVNGSLMAINMPSRQALVSDLVPKEKLMNAVSLNNSGTNLTRTIGPALAGILIVYIDTAGVFYIISGCYIFSFLSLAMIRTYNRQVSVDGKSMTKDIREGIKYAMKDSTLRGLIITLFMPVFFGFSLIILLPAWGREALQVEADNLGLLMMIMGSGSLVGTLILAAIRNLNRRGAWLLIIRALWGGSMALFSASTAYAVAMPLSMLPFGAIAEWIGTPNTLFLSGVMLTILTIVFTVANPKFREID